MQRTDWSLPEEGELEVVGEMGEWGIHLFYSKINNNECTYTAPGLL